MISIIITAFKEEKTIARAIEAILNQKISEKYEIIVVAPDDATLNVAKKFKKVKILKDSGKGKPIALNLAFKKAKGRILVLTDGDVFLGKDAINFITGPFKDKKVGIVSGRPVPTNSRKNKFGYWAHLLTEAGAHQERLKRRKKGKFIVCSGYLYAFRSGLLHKIPKEALSEDAGTSHFIYKKGYETIYAPKAKVYVKYPTNFRDWILQKRRSAGGYSQLKRQFKKIKRMRSFFREASKIFRIFSYPKNLKEFFWTIELIFARLYLWIIIYRDVKIKKTKLKKLWRRAASTKE